MSAKANTNRVNVLKMYRLFEYNKIPCLEVTTNFEVPPENFSSCCQMSKILQDQVTTVLKVMKYSIQPAVFYEPLEKFLKSFDSLDFMSFNNLTKFEKQRPLMECNPNPRVLMCQYAGGISNQVLRPGDCDLFHVSMTNNGIGYTFNNVNFWDMFSKTTYTNLFSKIITPKGFDRGPTTNAYICLGRDMNVMYSIKNTIFSLFQPQDGGMLNIQIFRFIGIMVVTILEWTI